MFVFRWIIDRSQTPLGATIVLLVFCITGVGIFFWRNQSQPEPANSPKNGETPIVITRAQTDKRITDQVDELRKESLLESLDNMAKPRFYFGPFGPGVHVQGELSRPMRFPLVPAIGQYDISTILSNRRFAKIYAEVARPPKDESANLLNKHIAMGLRKNKEDMDPWFARYSKLSKNEKEEQYVDNPVWLFNSEPTLHGNRFKTLGLILIAANIETPDSFKEIAAVTTEAKRQYSLSQELFSGTMGWLIARRDLMYNRQILATGLLKTAPPSDELKLLKEKYAGRWKTEKLTAFDAKYGVYDGATTRGFADPDFSNGEILVNYLEPITDEQFNEIANALLPAKK